MASFDNEPEKREHPPEISSIAVVESRDRVYLGWVNDEFDDESQVALFDSLEIKVKPRNPLTPATPVGWSSEVVAVMPLLDIPEVRYFGEYTEVQVYDVYSAVGKLYLDLRKYALAQRVSLNAKAALKGESNGKS
jgi:hypothetical protein